MEATEKYYKQWSPKSQLLEGYYSGVCILLKSA